MVGNGPQDYVQADQCVFVFAGCVHPWGNGRCKPVGQGTKVKETLVALIHSWICIHVSLFGELGGGGSYHMHS